MDRRSFLRHGGAAVAAATVLPLSGTVRRLRDQGIMASQTPYAEPHSRFTPCIYNTTEDVDQALEAVRAMG